MIQLQNKLTVIPKMTIKTERLQMKT